MNKSRSGFTLVELFIVIVIIGVLSAVTTVAYSGLMTRAQNTKIKADISLLKKVAMSAREANSKPLGGFLSGCGGGGESACCLGSGNIDLTSESTAPQCWQAWKQNLSALSAGTGASLSNMVDPWGQPYIIETQEAAGSCRQDSIYAVKPPVTGWGSTRLGTSNLPFSAYSDC